MSSSPYRASGHPLRHFMMLLFVCGSLTTSARAIETHIGTVRITTEVTCLNHCDDYVLEPDTGSTRYFLRGADLILYVGRHVQIFGYRTYCGGCLVISVTNVIRLPVTDVRLVDDRKPVRTQLLQNFPNPFNPTTVIRYELGSPGDVSLKVYDLLGKEIATLVAARQAPGTYELGWSGETLPSGMYYYRLQTPEGTITKKMILVR